MKIAALVISTIALTPSSAGALGCNDPFECHTSRAHKPPLTVETAKKTTRRLAAIEASSWDYPGYVLTSVASRCTRKSPRAIDCKFGVYQIGGPPVGERKTCHYTAHVVKPKNASVKSSVEERGCEFH